MADLIIRGMEMPKNCSVCRLRSDSWCLALGNDWRKAYNKPEDGERLPYCPLVPLPEKHGDLIDRDALLNEGADLSDGYWVGEYCEATEWGFSTKMIENAPTIVPAEGGGEDG